VPQSAFFELAQLGRIYLFSRGFSGKQAVCPDHRSRPTLAIGNLTGPEAERMLGISAGGNESGFGNPVLGPSARRNGDS
jgi:hypothetical protein